MDASASYKEYPKKSVPKINALVKVKNSVPKIPNIRIPGGGRSKLIALGVQGAIAGAGALYADSLYNKMQSNKK